MKKKQTQQSCSCKTCKNHNCSSPGEKFFHEYNNRPKSCTLYLENENKNYGATGPTGPRGPAGVKGEQGDPARFAGIFESVEELDSPERRKSGGEFYIVGNDMYFWEERYRRWRSFCTLPIPSQEASFPRHHAHVKQDEKTSLDYTPNFTEDIFHSPAYSILLDNIGAHYYGKAIKRLSGHLTIPYTLPYITGKIKLQVCESPLDASLLLNQGGSIIAPQKNKILEDFAVAPLHQTFNNTAYHVIGIDNEGELSLVYSLSSLIGYPGEIKIYYWVEYI